MKIFAKFIRFFFFFCRFWIFVYNLICEIVDDYPYVTMDTKFPGIVLHPVGNFKDNVFANDSIELLCQSGIDFVKNNEKGIDAKRFGELLMSYGIALNDSVHWVTFYSGYDFGYLLKLLTCQNLPDTQAGFFNLINLYFPTVYDIKHLMKFCNSLHGGLNKLTKLLEVERVGISHQAGSDSLFTSCTFTKSPNIRRNPQILGFSKHNEKKLSNRVPF
ncbi:hypothetical protein UlMin_023482 [Ulmus minor]